MTRKEKQNVFETAVKETAFLDWGKRNLLLCELAKALKAKCLYDTERGFELWATRRGQAHSIIY
jgi:hypothetical protein